MRVFGLDPITDPVGVLSRIGYLSEENDLPGWMRVDELIRYSSAFYPGWDDGYAEELRLAFALDSMAKINHLSKGQKARAGLLIALAYRPELLVLGEPSSGLDPIVRRDILGALSVLTIMGPILHWIGEHGEVQAALWNAIPLILGVLVCFKMSAAAWVATRLYRTRVLSDRILVRGAAAWVVAVLALYALLAWLLFTPIMPRYLLGLVAILAIPLARLSAAPLALAWNRHG